MMPVVPSQDRTLCPVCRAAVAAGAPFCAVCGARLEEPTAQELRGVLYLLSELGGWAAQGLIAVEEAAHLRRKYELRRDELRAQLAQNGEQPPSHTSLAVEASSIDTSDTFTPDTSTQRRDEATAHTISASANAPLARDVISQTWEANAARQASTARAQASRRTLFETLSDPYALRLLLYTGAAMLVVGIVIWLRDVLYLKLQEPLVQAVLLALGTVAVTISGWVLTLRTRLRLTGRALTLIGSLLVPVNFWFLVRSGLISNSGRAWIICALCAALYAFTAYLLRASLYVYLSCAASVATVWALVFRVVPEAYGLYALTLMTASLIFLHLSRLFPLSTPSHEQAKDARGSAAEAAPEGEDTNAANATDTTDAAEQVSRLSYQVWGTPLVRVALFGVAVAAFAYMLLRPGTSPALSAGIFRWRANDYDASIAMLLFVALAYSAWFTARFIYTDRRRLLYTLAALALFWTELLLLDGLRMRGQTYLLALSLTTLAASLVARLMKEEVLAQAVHRAAAIVAVALVLATPLVQLSTDAPTVRQSAALFMLGAALALLSTPRFNARLAQLAFAHASAVIFSLAFFVALTSGSLNDETIFAVCAVWPFVLYAGGQLMKGVRGEQQLVAPFVRVADVEFMLLFVASSGVALILYLVTVRPPVSWRPSVFFVLAATMLYGALRGWHERSTYGAGLASMAALVFVAALLDALRIAGLFPSSWPLAAGVVVSAFVLQAAARRWLQPEEQATTNERSTPAALSGATALDATIRLVTDGALIVCALLWFARMLASNFADGWSAVCVLLLAALYWTERVARGRSASLVYLMSAHAGACLLALLVALRVERRWMAAVFALTLFPALFALGRFARARGADWLATPASRSAAVLAAMLSFAVVSRAVPLLQAGNEQLLAPAVTAGALCAAGFVASLFSRGRERVRYFRMGLAAALAAFVLALLRAGFDPLTDVEIYTAPVAVVLLVVAYLSIRRAWDEYAQDTIVLLWTGSLLLCVPLLIRALEFRLLLDVPAPWRDLTVLCVSLALILFGVFGRLRAPVVMGTMTLLLELAALTLTSVDWLQLPLWIYLITAGVIIMTVWGMFEYHRERVIRIRQRLNERRAQARASFSQWR